MPDPSALILSVKFCNQETATHLRTQERNKRFSTLQLLITIFPFCHVLFGAICHVLLFVMFSLAPNLSFTRAGTCAHVHLFCNYVWRSKRGPDPKTWTHPHCPPSTIMMNDRCSFDGCGNRPTKNGNGRCRAHGGRTKCNHLGCDSFAQKDGMVSTRPKHIVQPAHL